MPSLRTSRLSTPSPTVLLLSVALCLVTGLNILLVCRGTARLEALVPPPKSREYTWLENDHPDQLPIEVPRVGMVWENPTERWGLYNDTEWGTMFDTDGFSKVGPHDRTFQISMVHQLHCLDVIRVGVVTNRTGYMHHIEHCLRYLRQSVLCCADTTLEESVVLHRDGAFLHGASGTGMVHECRDWTAVRRYMSAHPADDCDGPECK